MSEIKIETLTPVHIGSGRMLIKNNDFCVTKDSEDYDVVAVTDPNKVLSLIGIEHIDNWVRAIERGNPINEIINTYAPKGTKVEDYARIIDYFGGERVTETLKEFIHDGLGRPYIPGSSIKGAIRTAVMATEADKKDKTELDIIVKSLKEKKLSDDIFGEDTNNEKRDVFRFLIISDATFGELNTIAFNMVNINERTKQSYWDTSKPQLIEALAKEDETTFNIKLDLERYEKSKGHVHEMPECMRSLPDLFKTINSHTAKLLRSEIEYWEKRKNDDDSDKVEDYISNCRKILNETTICEQNGKSCILRLGHGCGWRFITGAWSERSDEFYYVKEKARPNNNKYQDYDFPKSRRVSKDCDLLGFVRLTMKD